MQRPDLSKHHLYLATCNKAKSVLIPRQFWLTGDDMGIWVMEDAALYLWRGLVPKVTANRLTRNMDYKLENSMLSLYTGTPGEDYTLIFIAG